MITIGSSTVAYVELHAYLRRKVMTRVVNKYNDRYDVYIGRGSPWGNPFRIGVDGDRELVIMKFREWFLSQPDLVARARRELKDKTLGCFCKPRACHGDVIAEIVDKEGA